MMLATAIFRLLLAAINLDGVSGGELAATAELDANNVRRGDPLTLTVDFIGQADFAALHPPRLSTAVDPKYWKVDDASARTETYRNARRLAYRVRPLVAGVYDFPAMEFIYDDASGRERRRVSTAPVPVHVKETGQITLSDEPARTRELLPMPDGLHLDLDASPWHSGDKLDRDGRFAWRKACSAPADGAFDDFDFPEGRLNAAAMAIAAGNPDKAMSIYRRLEWQIGQTPEIERGIVAARAAATLDPRAELPVWRRTMRPLLRYAWPGRLAFALTAIAAAGLLWYLVRRLVRVLACIAMAAALAAATAADARAEDPFALMEQMRREMDERMRQMSASFDMFDTGFNGQRIAPPDICAGFRFEPPLPRAGEPFRLIVELEAPRGCTLDALKLTPTQSAGFTILEGAQRLEDRPGTATNRVVRRISVPIRYDCPFSGPLALSIGGSATQRVSARGGRFVSTTTRPFETLTPTQAVTVAELPKAGRPADFCGAVGRDFRLFRRLSTRSVATNDVIRLECAVHYDGYLPDGALGGYRENDGEVVFRRYWRASGESALPPLELSYFDVDRQQYAVARAPAIRLEYHSDDLPATNVEVVVNAPGADVPQTAVEAKLYPRDSAPAIGLIDLQSPSCRELERQGRWRRLDDGRLAGWVKGAQ